jgi:hypothetical protein
MPEMVPWNDQDKNPIIRQPARISGKQVQQTISLDEAALPNASETQVSTIRVHHVSSSASTPHAQESQSRNEPTSEPTSWRPTAANAPAILPNVEARPLPVHVPSEPIAVNPAVASPLRGLSQGNPLRR